MMYKIYFFCLQNQKIVLFAQIDATSEVHKISERCRHIKYHKSMLFFEKVLKF